jgi:hypothetical protein
MGLPSSLVWQHFLYSLRFLSIIALIPLEGLILINGEYGLIVQYSIPVEIACFCFLVFFFLNDLVLYVCFISELAMTDSLG